MLYNLKENILGFLRTFVYIIAPVFTLSISFYIYKYQIIDINFKNLESNLISVSGTLAGFLFTAFIFFISLPDNLFVLRLKKEGYLKVVYKTLIIGVFTLIISLVLAMFTPYIKLMVSFFLIGLTESIVAGTYLYKVANLSSKSK